MLTYDQTIPALIFVTLIVCVYVAAIRHLIAAAMGRAPAGRTRVWERKIVWFLALAGLGCFAYGYFVEPYWPQVTHLEIRSPKLAAGGKLLRIVHISDVHSDPVPRLEERLPEIVASEKPDLILFSGDAANSVEGVPVFRRLIAELAKIAPTYGVQGNWDARYGSKIFEGTGAHELAGTGVTLEIGGNKIWLIGTPVTRANEIPEIVRAAPPDVFSIFVYHYPDEIYAVAGKVDLYCAGHTHGGQVALPLWGGLLTLSRFGKRFESGLFQVGGTTMYVNRGIGMEGDAAPRVRFYARPEITVYEIAPQRRRD